MHVFSQSTKQIYTKCDNCRFINFHTPAFCGKLMTVLFISVCVNIQSVPFSTVLWGCLPASTLLRNKRFVSDQFRVNIWYGGILLRYV